MRCLSLLLSFCLSSLLFANTPATGELLQAPGLTEAHVGIFVQELGSQQTLYKHQADKLFTPDSVMQLVTAAAVLDLVGGQTRFNTLVLAKDSPRHGRIAGDIVLKGGGDPSLNEDGIQQLAGQMWEAGIRKIEGNLLVDASYLVEESWNAGLTPPISGLCINGNCIDLFLHVEDKTPYVDLQGPEGFIAVENRLTVGKGERFEVKQQRRLPQLLLRGVVRPSTRVVITVPIEDSPLLAGLLLASALAERGIEFEGEIQRVPTPDRDWTVIAQVSSPPVRDLIFDMNKGNDPFYAEMLWQQIDPKSEHIEELVTAYLRPRVADALRVDGGSGLSHQALMSPRQMGALLNLQSENLDFRRSLSIAGFDGTLTHRFKGTALEGRLMAKAAATDGIGGLAGYAQLPDGRLVVFAIMINNTLLPPQELEHSIDSLTLSLLAND